MAATAHAPTPAPTIHVIATSALVRLTLVDATIVITFELAMTVEDAVSTGDRSSSPERHHRHRRKNSAAQAPTATVAIAAAVTIAAWRVVVRLLMIIALIAAAVIASRLGETPVAKALASISIIPPAAILSVALPRTPSTLPNSNPKLEAYRLNASKLTRPSLS
ncbi:uncharacterized protein CTHT_0040690 [Thermochaetoides thermophila DSM 1495]|uniref:Uncharacterized protein n=1 Tax=Chaetomium thermophilum (strain DSM 1495 / CBS 144.50 / IMI 039719) TaxID=759272 RepID=G0SA19_CHATD|nr:hypothetical protein CTHT_0040690 [Thermochaetoides thermophila DSM 1495]EGS19591.1 hypothetical protein CTHT_0040690 [Thermochaetoides thermophila DSM 1495]